MRAPVISDDVVEWLLKVYPEELPMSDNPNDYYRAQGRKAVIDRICLENRKQQL